MVDNNTGITGIITMAITTGIITMDIIMGITTTAEPEATGTANVYTFSVEIPAPEVRKPVSLKLFFQSSRADAGIDKYTCLASAALRLKQTKEIAIAAAPRRERLELNAAHRKCNIYRLRCKRL